MIIHDPAITALIERYHELLCSEEALAAETHEHLVTGMRQRKMTYGERLLCNVLRPYFISASAHAAIVHHAERVIRALVVICNALGHDRDLRDLVGLPAHVEPFAALDGEVDVPVAVARIDGLLDTSFRLSFIEYNPTPGGIAYGTELADMFLQTPIMQRMGRQVEVASPSMLDMLFQAVASWKSGGSLPSIGMVEFSYNPMAAEIETIFRYLHGRGVAMTSASADDAWEHRDGRLTLRGRPIDLVAFLNPLRASALLAAHGPAHPVFAAIQARSAHALNGLFRSALLFSKTLFALLSDPDMRQRFGPALAHDDWSFIPWTRRVRESKTGYRGQVIDLVPFVAEHRERFVLKMSEGFAGEGIVLGWESSAEEWTAALGKALAGTWVVQERVHMPALTYPVMRGGRVELEELYSDVCPYIWNDSRASGYLVRLAQDRLLNVSAGSGSMAPLMVIQGV